VVFPACLPNLIDQVEVEALLGEQQNLYKKIIVYYTKNQSTDLKGLTSVLDSQESKNWSSLVYRSEILYADWEERQLQSEFDQLVRRLKARWLQARMRQISADILLAEQAGSGQEVERLASEFNDISKKIADYIK